MPLFKVFMSGTFYESEDRIGVVEALTKAEALDNLAKYLVEETEPPVGTNDIERINVNPHRGQLRVKTDFPPGTPDHGAMDIYTVARVELRGPSGEMSLLPTVLLFNAQDWNLIFRWEVTHAYLHSGERPAGGQVQAMEVSYAWYPI